MKKSMTRPAGPRAPRQRKYADGQAIDALARAMLTLGFDRMGNCRWCERYISPNPKIEEFQHDPACPVMALCKASGLPVDRRRP